MSPCGVWFSRLLAANSTSNHSTWHCRKFEPWTSHGVAAAVGPGPTRHCPPVRPGVAWHGFCRWQTESTAALVGPGGAAGRAPGHGPDFPEASRDQNFQMLAPPVPAQELGTPKPSPVRPGPRVCTALLAGLTAECDSQYQRGSVVIFSLSSKAILAAAYARGLEKTVPGRCGTGLLLLGLNLRDYNLFPAD